MSAVFDEIHNLQEQAVFSAIAEIAPTYPHFDVELTADVGCVALNRLPPRYVRHTVDFTFYQTTAERESGERAIDDGSLRVRIRAGAQRNARPHLTR